MVRSHLSLVIRIEAGNGYTNPFPNDFAEVPIFMKKVGRRWQLYVQVRTRDCPNVSPFARTGSR